MKLRFTHRPALRAWIRASAVLLLCASTVALYGFDDKKTTAKPAPVVHSAPVKTNAPVHNAPVVTPKVNNPPVTTNPNLSNRPITTNPNLNNRPITTTTNPNLNNRPITPNPNLNNRPITTTTNPNLTNKPITTNPNLNNRPITTTTNPNLNNRPITTTTNPNLNNKPITTTPNLNNRPITTNPNFNNRPINPANKPNIEMPLTPATNPNLNNRPITTNPNFNNRPITPSAIRAPILNPAHLPQGSQATKGPGGYTNVTTRTGGQYQLNPQGHVSSFRAQNGATANFRPNGAPQVVHTSSGATVIHNNYGGRTVIVNRPNNTVIVSHGAGRGYVQHPFMVQNRAYTQRTYVVNNVRTTRVYQSYRYHGQVYNYYVRPRYYRPAFYGWAYNPWARPVAYSWGWGVGTPWFGFYGGYFQPYPVYRSPAFWLTDYLISTTLMAAYDARMADQANAAEQNAAQMQMSEQVKQMVADEVQRQLAQARAESQSGGQAAMAPAGDGLPSSFTDNAPHAFVVSNSLDVNDGASGCPLGEGDVVAFNGSLPPGADSMSVRVVASRGSDCPVGSMVAVQIQDLMEMQNHLRATLDQGLEQMQSNAGHGGLPALPSGSTGYVDTPLESAAPPPDPNAAAELTSGTEQASQEELAVLNQASDAGGGDAAAGGNAVSLGMTVAQVRGIVGNMRLVASVGTKQIYEAGGLKITFINGQVTNVE